MITDNGVLDALSPNNFHDANVPVVEKRDKDLILSLKWVSIDPKVNDTTFMSFLKLNTAKNYSDFRQALTHYVAPAQNFIYADNDGNFGYQMPGKVPKRAKGHTGKLPVPGYDNNYTWQTMGNNDDDSSYIFMDFDLMPRTYNPSKGFIASANNRVTPDGFEKEGYLLTHDWDASLQGYRSKRITKLIEQLSGHGDGGNSTRSMKKDKKMLKSSASSSSSYVDNKNYDSNNKNQNEEQHNILTTNDMRAIQLDYQSGWYDDFAKVIDGLLDEQDTLKLSEDAIHWGVRLVDPFDGYMSVGSYEATIFAKFMGAISTIGTLETGADNFFSANYLRKVFLFEGDEACEKTLKTTYNIDTWKILKHKTKLQSACLKFAALQLNNITKDLNGGNPGRWGLDIHPARFTNQILHGTPLKCVGDVEVSNYIRISRVYDLSIYIHPLFECV